MESIAYVDQDRVRRSVSLDAQLDESVLELADFYRLESIPLPLGWMERRLLVKFDLYGDNTMPKPLMTRKHVDDLSAAALYAFFETENGSSERAAWDLTFLAHADSSRQAWRYYNTLFNGPTARMPFSAAQGLAEMHVMGFPLVCELTRESAESRQILKYSFEDPIHIPGSSKTMSTTINVSLGNPEACRSYHFEFCTPSGLYASEIEADFPKLEVGRVVLGGTPEIPAAFLEGCVKNLGLPGGADQLDDPLASIVLRARPEGVVRNAFLVGVVNAAILWAGSAWSSLLPIGDKSAASAVLLAIPATYSVWITRPGEHVHATSVLFPTRVLAILSAILLWIATIGLVVADDIGVVAGLWGALAVYSTATASALMMGWLHSDRYLRRAVYSATARGGMR